MKTQLLREYLSKSKMYASELAVLFGVLLIFLLQINQLYAQQVTTLAGTGAIGSADGAGNSATFRALLGLTADGSANVYVVDSDNHKIRKVTPAGVVSTIAGSGVAGSADGTGTSASFNYPYGLVVDKWTGNMYVADLLNHKIRMITPAGVVSTFAGSGAAGASDGTGTAASFNLPSGIAIDVSGNLYVADSYNNKIRKITSAGVVTTLAGTGATGAIDGAGASATFNRPSGLAVDNSGNVYVADQSNNKIRKITPAGVVSTFAGSGLAGSANGTGTAATFSSPFDLHIAPSGNLYVADTYNNKIRKITPAGVVTTFAGSGASGSTDGTGSAADFNLPNGIEGDEQGSLYVADLVNNKVRKIKLLPEIKIAQAGNELVSGSGSYNFGTVDVSSTSGYISFDLSNTSGSSENLLYFFNSPNRVNISGDVGHFIVNASTLPFSNTINGGDTAPFSIAFSPTSPGVKTATVTIYNNDDDESVYTFTITGTGKANQSISGLPNLFTNYGSTFTLSGIASSSLPVSYSSANPGIASISGSNVSIHALGTVTITAMQPGNAYYHAAPNVTFNITVDPAPLTIKADDKTKGEGSVNPTLTVTYTGLVNGENATVLGCSVTPQTTASISSPIGSYPITVTDCGYTNTNYTYTFVDGTLEIVTPTGTQDQMSYQIFSVSPNPTSGEFIVNAIRNLEISIFDSQGLKVFDQKISKGTNIISLGNIKNGIYFIRCSDPINNYQVQKIIKN